MGEDVAVVEVNDRPPARSTEQAQVQGQPLTGVGPHRQNSQAAELVC